MFLLIIGLAVLARLYATVIGRASVPGRAVLGWTCLADIVGILLAIFGGIFIMLFGGRSRECGTDDCDAIRWNPAAPYVATAAYLLYTVAYALLVSPCDLRSLMN